MGRIFSPSVWGQAIISTIMTLVIIYAIKKVAGTVNIPVVSEVANAV